MANSDPVSLESPRLVRRIGLPLLTFYGLGTILGAGIYVLVGKVAASAGLLAPLAFLLAASVAAVTALSYCQLVVVFPKSAGEAHYVDQGFKRRWLTILVGYLVILTGIVSAATLANGFVGYLSSFVELPRVMVISIVVVSMGLIAFWGIAESLWLAAVITIIEFSGLLLVVFLAGGSLSHLPQQWDALLIPMSVEQVFMVASGAFLAFYAFIGFEDMVNVVEEVKEPKKTMPKAIILALVVSSALYLLISLVAVLGLPLSRLSASEAPLRDLLAEQYPLAGGWVGLISLFAIINGVLIQVIMASRVLYGMADQGNAPALFSRVSPITHTPGIATLVVVILLLFFAIWLPLITLAKMTSFVILIIFTLINVSLWYLIRRRAIAKDQRLTCWPILGAGLCLALLIFQLFIIAR